MSLRRAAAGPESGAGLINIHTRTTFTQYQKSEKYLINIINDSICELLVWWIYLVELADDKDKQ